MTANAREVAIDRIIVKGRDAAAKLSKSGREAVESFRAIQPRHTIVIARKSK